MADKDIDQITQNPFSFVKLWGWTILDDYQDCFQFLIFYGFMKKKIDCFLLSNWKKNSHQYTI